MKPESPAEMDRLASRALPDLQATLGSAHSERKVSQDSQGSRVVLEAPVILALAMWELRASAESLVRLVSLGCQGNLDNLGREATCYLAPYLVRLETLDTLVCLEDQEQKVRQVFQEDLDVQVLTVQKETEEILVSEACQGLQVSLVPEEILEFQAFQDRVSMEPVGRMVSQVFLGLRVSLARSWVPHLDRQD